MHCVSTRNIHFFMNKICRLTGKPFTISPAEQAYCEQNNIPLPTLHPIERLRQMMVFRNRISLYNATCGFSGESILSSIDPRKGFMVYDVDIWESEKWDPLEYGREYDFGRPFFDQFAELMHAAPWPNLFVIRSTMENSDYTNGITTAKNCYLLFGSIENEACMFSHSLWRCRDVVDCVYTKDSELCYDSRNVHGCYNLRFSENCQNCSDSYFLYNCQSCKNCYGCMNLSNKEFCIGNKQYTKEEYLKRIASFELGSSGNLKKLKADFAKYKENFPIKYLFGKNNENSSGNFLNNTKNVRNSFFVSNGEDLEYCLYLDKAKSSFFHSMYGSNSELVYNCQSCGDNAYNLKFCVDCWPNASTLEYCMFVGQGSADCFGSFGLKKKQYCILNKQYDKQTYVNLLAKIKEQMRKNGEYGQFFPAALSPFYYNQSDADYFFPLAKEDALQNGLSWNDEQIEPFESTYSIPDHIKDVGDDILDQTLKCEQTGKKYKIIKQELELYRRMQLPIPRVAPLERIKDRLGIFAIREPRAGTCGKCAKNIETVYDTDDQKVYCEECYLKEVY